MSENSYSGMTLAEKVLEQIRVSDTVLQKAAAAEKTQQEKQAEVAARIPDVVDALLRNERIQPSQQEKLAGMLHDPVKVLELMVKVADHRNADEVAKLGQGVVGGEKTASVASNPSNSLTNPFVGIRNTRVKQSSVNLFRGLGLADPESE